VLEERFEEIWRIFNEKVHDKHPIFQAAKIAEETGEAINFVFKLVGFRRENYNVQKVREKLSGELADIVITTFICAKVCEVNLWEAVDKKLCMEIKRWQEFRTST